MVTPRKFENLNSFWGNFLEKLKQFLGWGSKMECLYKKVHCLHCTKFSISLPQPNLLNHVFYKVGKTFNLIDFVIVNLNQNYFRLKMKPNTSKIVTIIFKFKISLSKKEYDLMIRQLTFYKSHSLIFFHYVHYFFMIINY